MFGESFIWLVQDTFKNIKVDKISYFDDLRIKGYHFTLNGITFSVQFGPGNYCDSPLHPADDFDFTKVKTAECAYFPIDDSNPDWDQSIRGYMSVWDCILYMLDVFSEE